MMNVLHRSMSSTEQYNTSKNKSTSWQKIKHILCFWFLPYVSLFQHTRSKKYVIENELDLSHRRRSLRNWLISSLVPVFLLSKTWEQYTDVFQYRYCWPVRWSVNTSTIWKKSVFKPNNNKVKQFVSQKLSDYSTAQSSLIHVSLLL